MNAVADKLPLKLPGLNDETVVKARRKRLGLVWASRIIFSIGLILVLLCSLGLLGPASDGVLTYLSALGVITILLGALLNRPKPVGAWFFFLAAALMFGAGNVIRAQWGTLGYTTFARPDMPDLLIFSGYILIIIGLILLSNYNHRKIDLDGVIDAGIIAAGVMLVTWVYLVEPQLTSLPTALISRITVAAYAPISVFIFALTINYAYGRDFRQSSVSSRYLSAALGLLFVGDLLYMLADTGNVELQMRLLDAPYALAFLLFPIGALHPSVNEVSKNQSAPKPLSLLRLGIVTTGLILPVIVFATKPLLPPEDETVVAVMLLVLIALSVSKLFRALWGQRQVQQKLAFEASHDSLTGLPNRSYALNFLEEALKEAEKKNLPLSVMFLDLDRFKNVNDTMGHAVGDGLIKAMGQRIRACVHRDHMVARLGGDEFVVALPAVSLADAEMIAHKILEEMALPFQIGSFEINSNATIGISSYENDLNTSGAALIEAADTALYEGKEKGRGRVVVFNDTMRTTLEKQTRTEAALRSAEENNELSLLFQPIVSTRSGKVTSCESLLRWNSETLGKIPPDIFIPIAEETGMIVPIGRWILNQACKEVASWRKEIDPTLKVSVNVSARQLSEPDFVSDVKKALEDNELTGEALDLEITESMLVPALDQIGGRLKELKNMGITLSVDDFGTGYSSLAYLKRFPVNRLKVDKSFVVKIDDPESSDRTLVQAMVSMSAGLGLEVVAEGVETQPQAQAVAELGVAYIQGYLFSRPVAGNEVKERINKINQTSIVPLPCPIEGK